MTTIGLTFPKPKKDKQGNENKENPPEKED